MTFHYGSSLRLLSVGITFAVLVLASPHAVPMARSAALSEPQIELAPPERPPPPVPKFLGALLTANTAGWRSLIRSYGGQGVLVLGAVPGSSAAGELRIGSVIVAVGEKAVTDEESLSVILRSHVELDEVVRVVDPDGTTRAQRIRLSSSPPDSAEVLEYLNGRAGRDDPTAQFLLAQGRTSPAAGLADIERLLDSNPSFSEFHAAKARMLFQQMLGDEKAEGPENVDSVATIIAALSTALELDPESFTVRQIASETLLGLGRPDVAETQAVEAVRLGTNAAKARNLLGRSRLQLGRPADALSQLHRAVELNPFDEAYYQDLARAYVALGRSEDADTTNQALEALRSHSSAGLAAKIGVTRKLVTTVLVGAFVLFALAESRRPRAERRHDQPLELSVSRGSTHKDRLAVIEGITLLGLWTVASAYVGPLFALVKGLPSEFILPAHVVPGMVVVITGMGLHRVTRQGDSESPGYRFTAISLIILFCAGVWVIASHISLVVGTLREEGAWGEVIWFSITGPVILALVAWLAWSEESRFVPRNGGPRQPVTPVPSGASSDLDTNVGGIGK